MRETVETGMHVTGDHLEGRDRREVDIDIEGHMQQEREWDRLTCNISGFRKSLNLSGLNSGTRSSTSN